MQSQINFTLSFWVNATRIKNNQVSVYSRITVNGKRANISLQRKVILSEWDSRRGRAKGNKQESRLLNRYLDQVKNRGYANDLEASGIMDLFRIPKPMYYFYKSQRDADNPNGKPMIYIANQWKEDSPLDIRIFSNCEEVELFLNGKSLGKQKPDNNRISDKINHPPFTFNLSKYQKGNLEAKGFINNKIVANHTVKSPNKPQKIELKIDKSSYEIDKKNNDVVLLYANIMDENETIITNSLDSVKFTLEGNAELIGENPVKLEAGTASILLKVSKKSKNYCIDK